MTADEPLPVGMSMTNRWHATETLQQDAGIAGSRHLLQWAVYSLSTAAGK